MSATDHPIAKRLALLGDSELSLLALVMGLPLIDGIFPALVLAGALDNLIGAVQVGLLIFGGSATVAVILGEMDGTPRSQVRVVLLVGVPLVALAALQAAIAPAIASVLDLFVFEHFAALVIAAIAAKTASATVGEYLPSPGVIVALGLLASFDPSGAEFTVLGRPMLVVNATVAAVVGVGFALALAASGPVLRQHVDVDRFRFGCALALGLMPLSLLGMAFGQAPLAVLLIAGIFAFDPGTDPDGSEEERTPRPTDGMPTAHRTDGGRRANRQSVGGVDDDLTATERGAYPGDDGTDTTGRAPWL